jgi:hypothetical protein
MRRRNAPMVMPLFKNKNRRAASAIDFIAMTNAEDQYKQAGVFDLADEPVVTDAVSPELPESGAVQGLADAAGIVQLRYPFPEELQNPPRLLRV